MSPNGISILVFGSLFASALLAIRLRVLLPEPHLGGDTKDTVKLTMGLVATMTALVLGLLVASTKGAYDTEKSEVTQMAAKIIYLDRVLVRYGPETAATRDLLRQTVGMVIKNLWSTGTSVSAQPEIPAKAGEVLRESIQKLEPQNDAQRLAKSEAMQVGAELGQLRWLLFEQLESSISTPMLLVVVCWLAILFFSFGLFAPANATAIGALVVAALSVSGAIFLILELDHPFNGWIQISSGPMRSALAHLNQ